MKGDKAERISYLVGDSVPDVYSLPPYSDIVCDFIASLSEALLRDRANRAFPDAATFAFFCRRANIAKLKRDFADVGRRLGRGLAFHITPSNVPINFAFSLVFGMLAGNSNIVRVPTKKWPQVDIVCGAVKTLLDLPAYAELAPMISMARYGRDDEITEYFSSLCDARIIWGGDATVASIRKIPIPARSVEITFADRYSCCVLDAEAVLAIDGPKLKKLADAFYNDTYLIDQNACSSPNLIIWLGERVAEAGEKFWAAVEKSARRYDLAAALVMEKYTSLCDFLAGDFEVKAVKRHGNLIYRAELERLGNVEECRGRYGMFFEYAAKSLDDLAGSVTARWQTLTYFGVEPEKLGAFVIGRKLRGIDRIVPVGDALNIGVVWDGYDIVGTLSRIVSF